jgi:phosphatidylinositol-3-phosphatase
LPERRAATTILAATVIAVLAGATVLALLARQGPPSAAPATQPPESAAPGSTLPAFSHVFLIVMENHDVGQIVGSRDAPYLNELIARGGLATTYAPIRHPSQPNYLGLFSGSVHGDKDDGPHDIQAPTLADQLEAARLTWRVVAQNWPGGCFTGATASGGEDGPGTYVRKHNPAISFTTISGDPARCQNIIDLSRFDPAAASFQFIVPNLCNDMHDCPVSAGDQFLSSFVPKILQSSAWSDGGVLFITWDEGPEGSHGLHDVPLIVLSSRTPAGMQSAAPHTHYSLLLTIERAWHLPCLDEACYATDLAEFFGPAPAGILSPGASGH